MASDPDEVLEALRRILDWPEIARSPQLARFMSHIVERKLAGQEDAIKAYSIAVDVFGRPADFDPQVDPIVRVQARRLRGLLDEYYRDAGRSDPIRIHLPTGRYVPEFIDTRVEKPGQGLIPAEPMARAPRRFALPAHISWLALLALTGLVAVLAFGLSTWGPGGFPGSTPASEVPRPLIIVEEFQNLTGDTSGSPRVAGLAIELVTDLEQFEDLDVRYQGQSSETREVASLAPASFVLSGIVRTESGLVQYSAILTDISNDDVVWSRAVAVDPVRAAEASGLDEVSRELALVLGSSRGPLHAPVRAWLMGRASSAGQEGIFLCLELFHMYRDTGLSVDADRATSCLESIPEMERQSALALAASASLLVDGLDRSGESPSGPGERFNIADTMLARAIDLAPVSGFVWEQRARYHEAVGEQEKARAAYGSAIQLNPANADSLAALARLLALGGSIEAARPLSDAALKSPEPPAWYFYVPTILALRGEDYGSAIDAATRYALADRELGPILAVMASLAGGETGVVNRYLPQILDLASFRAAGILPQLRKRVTDQALLRDIRIALTNAGVPLEALTGPY